MGSWWDRLRKHLRLRQINPLEDFHYCRKQIPRGANPPCNYGISGKLTPTTLGRMTGNLWPKERCPHRIEGACTEQKTLTAHGTSNSYNSLWRQSSDHWGFNVNTYILKPLREAYSSAVHPKTSREKTSAPRWRRRLTTFIDSYLTASMRAVLKQQREDVTLRKLSELTETARLICFTKFTSCPPKKNWPFTRSSVHPCKWPLRLQWSDG